MSAYLNSTNVSTADDGKLLQIQVNYIIQYQTYTITSNYTVLNFYKLFGGTLFLHISTVQYIDCKRVNGYIISSAGSSEMKERGTLAFV